MENPLMNTKIKAGIDALLQEVKSIGFKIEGIKPPESSKSSEYEGILKKIADFRGRPLFLPYVGSGVGNGVYVELLDGSVKLDFINGIGVHILGHSHPTVIKASLEGALSDIVNQGHLQANKEYLEFGSYMAERASKNSRLKYSWLTTCGTMANENALKIARQKKTPANIVIAMEGAFAGRSTMMAEVSDNPAYKVGLPSYNEVLRIPYYDEKNTGSKEKAFSLFKEHVANNDRKVCCFSFEPMLGEGGYKVAPREFFLPILEFCRDKSIPVWADEVQTFCRTGEVFAFETLDIGEYIDIVTIAKPAQIGITIYTEEMNPQPGLIAGTFAGSTGAIKAGMETVKFLENGNYFGSSGRIKKINEKFVGLLNDLNETSCKGQLKDAGGMGLMIGVTPFDGSKEKVFAFVKNLFNNGLMGFGCGRDPYRIRFLIPAIVEDKDLEIAAKTIEKTILEMA